MTGNDTQPAMAYPTQEQYNRWKSRAADLEMSVSEFIQHMVEAGMKNLDATYTGNDTNKDLRRQRDDLKSELQDARDRINWLESQLHDDERKAVQEYIKTHPGCRFPEVVQHLIDTAPERVNRHLDALEGDAIRTEDELLYPNSEEAAK